MANASGNAEHDVDTLGGLPGIRPVLRVDLREGLRERQAGLEQGFRFGLYVGAMLSLLHGFGWYVILPIPLGLSFYWFVAILVEFIAAGIAAGLVYHE